MDVLRAIPAKIFIECTATPVGNNKKPTDAVLDKLFFEVCSHCV